MNMKQFNMKLFYYQVKERTALASTSQQHCHAYGTISVVLACHVRLVAPATVPRKDDRRTVGRALGEDGVRS